MERESVSALTSDSDDDDDGERPISRKKIYYTLNIDKTARTAEMFC